MDPRVRAGIFQGESGGDYDTLFGHSQRQGGQFAGTKLTGMTVDQAIQFTDPSGPYANWVKGKVGRVATPVGAYQVVGSTLAAIKKSLGLRGDELMTPELQDRIGDQILKEQGTAAWAGYKGPREPAAETIQGGYTRRPAGPEEAAGGGSRPDLEPASGYVYPTGGGAPGPAGAGGGEMPPMPVIQTKEKRKNLAEMMAGALGNMGGGGQQALPALPATPQAARVDAPALGTTQMQRNDIGRQQLAYALQKLNAGKLVI